MANNNTNQKLEHDSPLPSRRDKHKKDKHIKKEERSDAFHFPLVRIIFFTFLALIISIIVFLLWEEYGQQFFMNSMETNQALFNVHFQMTLETYNLKELQVR